jgi:hypothetical protein
MSRSIYISGKKENWFILIQLGIQVSPYLYNRMRKFANIYLLLYFFGYNNSILILNYKNMAQIESRHLTSAEIANTAIEKARQASQSSATVIPHTKMWVNWVFWRVEISTPEELQSLIIDAGKRLEDPKFLEERVAEMYINIQS